MIFQNIFVPEKIGSYYLFPKRIIGFDINKTHVYVTQLLLKGRTITLEKTIEIPLEVGNTNNYDERASKAIATALEQVDKYDAIHTALSSSLAIFKELRLPFSDPNKIQMVIEFEVEPLLPFSVNDAVVDFIITKHLPDEKASEVLVAAVQKQHIVHHLQLFAQAGVNPDVITLDLFALYGAFKLIPSYADLPGGTVLVDVGSNTTGIAYIQNGQLRLIRSISKGLLSQAKAVSQALNIPVGDAMERLIRFGLEKTADPTYLQAATTAFTDFWQDVSFTITSFTAQTEQQPVSHVLLLGNGSEIKGLSSFVSHMLGIVCEPFQIHKLLQNSSLGFTTKNGITPGSVISFCIALPTPITSNFNLRRKEFSIGTDRTILLKQLIASISLTVFILVLLLQHDFFQARKLNNAAQQAEEEVIEALKKDFKQIPRDETNLDSVVGRARAEVQREEKLWFSFANPGRTSFLQYLLELTNIINKEELGFSIDKLIITENTITMDAHVKDHAALSILESELKKSKLFAPVGSVQTIDFSMKLRVK